VAVVDKKYGQRPLAIIKTSKNSGKLPSLTSLNALIMAKLPSYKKIDAIKPWPENDSPIFKTRF